MAQDYAERRADRAACRAQEDAARTVRARSAEEGEACEVKNGQTTVSGRPEGGNATPEGCACNATLEGGASDATPKGRVRNATLEGGASDATPVRNATLEGGARPGGSATPARNATLEGGARPDGRPEGGNARATNDGESDKFLYKAIGRTNMSSARIHMILPTWWGETASYWVGSGPTGEVINPATDGPAAETGDSSSSEPTDSDSDSDSSLSEATKEGGYCNELDEGTDDESGHETIPPGLPPLGFETELASDDLEIGMILTFDANSIANAFRAISVRDTTEYENGAVARAANGVMPNAEVVQSPEPRAEPEIEYDALERKDDAQ
jgi:hypothetical protein